jgi:hypothetical protein
LSVEYRVLGPLAVFEFHQHPTAELVRAHVAALPEN